MTSTKAHESSDHGIRRLVDITDRAFSFAVRIVKLCKFLEKESNVSRNVINQLLNAGTSVGANLEEAVAAQSKADFIHKNGIALKEARESNYRLRLIIATNEFNPSTATGIVQLEKESMEISRIVAKRIVTSKRNLTSDGRTGSRRSA